MMLMCFLVTGCSIMIDVWWRLRPEAMNDPYSMPVIRGIESLFLPFSSPSSQMPVDGEALEIPVQTRHVGSPWSRSTLFHPVVMS